MKSLNLLPLAEQLAAFDLGPHSPDDSPDVTIGETPSGIPIVRRSMDHAPDSWLAIRAGDMLLDVTADGTLYLGRYGREGVELTVAQFNQVRALLAELDVDQLVAAAALPSEVQTARSQWGALCGGLGRLWVERLGYGAWLELEAEQRAALVELSKANDITAIKAAGTKLCALGLPHAVLTVAADWLTTEAEAMRIEAERAAQRAEREAARRATMFDPKRAGAAAAVFTFVLDTATPHQAEGLVALVNHLNRAEPAERDRVIDLVLSAAASVAPATRRQAA